MNNPMITSPNHSTAEQELRKPSYKGLHLVIRSDRSAVGSPRVKAAGGLTLAATRTPGAEGSADIREARSAESIRMKLAACFGAILTAPVVWCLHTLVLSLHTR